MHSHNRAKCPYYVVDERVLILVVMEDALAPEEIAAVEKAEVVS